jgi:hypothetical protein
MPCPHNATKCPGPEGYNVDDLDSGICGDCEIEAMCSEPVADRVTNRHGLLVCEHAGCKRPAVTGGRCDWHQDLAEG